MRKYTPHLGILLIIIGTITLILTRINALSIHNSLLLTGLLLIVAGILLHIYNIKHESNY